jgi:hypothetical protein
VPKKGFSVLQTGTGQALLWRVAVLPRAGGLFSSPLWQRGLGDLPDPCIPLFKRGKSPHAASWQSQNQLLKTCHIAKNLQLSCMDITSIFNVQQNQKTVFAKRKGFELS